MLVVAWIAWVAWIPEVIGSEIAAMNTRQPTLWLVEGAN